MRFPDSRRHEFGLPTAPWVESVIRKLLTGRLDLKELYTTGTSVRPYLLVWNMTLLASFHPFELSKCQRWPSLRSSSLEYLT